MKIVMELLGIRVEEYILNSEQLIFEMENMIPDPSLENKPWYANRVYSMADDGPPPQSILNAITSFFKGSLRSIQDDDPNK